MEKQDLSKILITDSEYYNPYSSYAKHLSRKNMTTVEELLNIELADLVKKTSIPTRWQLIAFYKILRHKYFGEALVYEKFLNCYIEPNSSTYGCTMHVSSKKGEVEGINLERVFGCAEDEINSIYKNFEYDMSKNGVFPKEKIKLIDFFKWEELQKYKVLANYANTYVHEYEKDKRKQNTDKIEFLKQQMAALMDVRNNLDKQIDNIEYQIDMLEEHRNSIKR